MNLHEQYMYKILAFCYRKYRKCSECCYATNCHAAFTNHRKEYHSTRRTCRQTSNKREGTPQFYCLCICGFVSSSGNKTGSLGLFCSNKCMHILISVMISKYFHILTLIKWMLYRSVMVSLWQHLKLISLWTFKECSGQRELY